MEQKKNSGDKKKPEQNRQSKEKNRPASNGRPKHHGRSNEKKAPPDGSGDGQSKEKNRPASNGRPKHHGRSNEKKAPPDGCGDGQYKKPRYPPSNATGREALSSESRGYDRRRGYNNRAPSYGNTAAATTSNVRATNEVSSNFQASMSTHAIPRHIDEFWRDLERRGRSNNGKKVDIIDVYNESTRKLWIETWDHAASGGRGNLRVLVKVLLQLPSLNIALPRHDIVLRVLTRLIVAGDANTEDFECVVNIVRNRLTENVRHIKTPVAYVEDAKNLENSWLNRLKSLLSRSDVEKLMLVGQILSRSLDFKQYIDLLNSGDGIHEDEDGDTDNTWLGWRDKPSVDWLLSGSWLQGPKLRKSYENADDYANSLLNIWTLLTFYWGAGALWPKCVTKGNNQDKVCAEPMLCPSTAGSCTQRKSNGGICGEVAEWRCHRHNHDSLCKSCLVRIQSNLCGRPGQLASTDVYDGQVDRETVRRDGAVTLLSKLISRKPPNIAPNWKTSYRLKASGLVGIIKLKATGEPLSRNQSIQWGEIVPYKTKSTSTTDEDWKFRASGQMAVRLIGRHDCSSFPASADTPLEILGKVAVIDLRVFVPEVISVLSIFAQRNFSEILSQIPFIHAIIGSQMAPEKLLTGTSNSMILINNAVQTSDITVLRLAPSYVKDNIVRRIYKMKQFQSLYGTQLEAFAMGLNKAVHCTQGPPGTGKSFVGVALVLALVIIREELKSDVQPLGPVLMLSYKNHALDEFLVDTIKFSEKPIRKGQLVRVGIPENIELMEFKERSSVIEKKAEEELICRVEAVRQLQRVEKEWRDIFIFFKTKSNLLEEHRVNRDQFSKFDSLSAASYTNEVVVLVKALSLLSQTVSNDLNSISPSKAFNLSKNMVNSDGNHYAVPLKIENLGMDSLVHWRPHVSNENISFNDKYKFYLEEWLKGSVPPPRCIGKVTLPSGAQGQCLEHAGENCDCCDAYHRCYNISECIRCSNQCEYPISKYCQPHRCIVKDDRGVLCANQMSNVSKYCFDHICGGCRVPNLRPKNGPFSCDIHRCKVELIKPCLKLELYPHPYCEDHTCIACVELNIIPANQIVNGSTKLCSRHNCAYRECVSYIYCHPNKAMQSRFCKVHSCVLCIQLNSSAVKEVDGSMPTSQLCNDHKCQYADIPCSNAVVPNSKFCHLHTCKICHKCNLYAQYQLTDIHPRNVCFLHPLCCYISLNGKSCNATVVKDSNYCDRHTNNALPPMEAKPVQRESLLSNGFCAGMTKKGKNCLTKNVKGPGGPIWYCKDHQSQNVLKENPVIEDDTLDGSNEVIDIPQFPLKEVPKGLLPDKSKLNFSCSKLGCQSRAFVNHSDMQSANRFCYPHHLENAAVQEKLKANAIVKAAKPVDPVKGNKNELASSTKKANDPVVHVIEKEKTEKSQPKEDEWVNITYNVDDKVALDADELDIIDDEGNEDMMRLRDIMDNEEYVAENESDISDEVGQVEDLAVLEEEDDILGDLSDMSIMEILEQWSWDMSTKQRHVAVSLFLLKMTGILNKLKSKCDDYVFEARLLKSQAGASIYKQSNIIGATVVGASRRLETIRASEPFAVVVEEACEVMEPTLVSVLAVKSLLKLELIGDHRQLPAFVQNCWYNVETTIPSIKVSLFERLISDGNPNKKGSKSSGSMTSNEDSFKPYTVLDEQRRMRKEIADITRAEYNDIVHIIDHPHTSKQCLGDKVTHAGENAKLSEQKQLWEDRGMTVPGMEYNIFFWNIDGNKEGRPIAGLSACNPTEAEAVCQLVKWMILCGIPRSSISVITPYKGQKTAIISALRKAKIDKDNSDESAPPVFVSTVDRYQGDENDIVILSLVKTEPGNRFVALLNRWIVAMSRARLGFYIIGSVNAVTKFRSNDPLLGPPHWKKFIAELKADEAESKVGSFMPVCCPRHRSKRTLGTPFPTHETWSTLCTVTCKHPLKECIHNCQLPCHSPSLTSHTKKCMEKVQRPCSTHRDNLMLCHEARGSFSTLKEALEKNTCDVPDTYSRPECGHVVKVTCYQKNEILQQRLELKPCEVIVSDFHKSCGHIISKPKCAERRSYEMEEPQCKENVNFNRRCGCNVTKSCHEKTKEMMNPIKCPLARNFPRPRCSHKVSMRCCDGEDLNRTWTAHSYLSVDSVPNSSNVLVRSGAPYGPPESDHFPTLEKCKLEVDYLSKCGHIIPRVPCFLAFQLAKNDFALGDIKCESDVIIESPLCGHQIKIKCCLSSKVHNWSPWNSDNYSQVIEGLKLLKEEALRKDLPISNEVQQYLSNACKKSIQMKRLCGHIIDISCNDLFKMAKGSFKLPICQVIVSRELKCGHNSDVLCCEKLAEPGPFCYVHDQRKYTYPCGLHHVVPGTCGGYNQLVKSSDPCPEITNCRRYRCHHNVAISCGKRYLAENPSPGRRLSQPSIDDKAIVESLPGYCKPENISICIEKVSFRLVCGHIIDNVDCHKAFEYASDQSTQPECRDIVQLTSPLCRHPLSLPCSSARKLNEWDAWDPEGFPQYDEITDQPDQEAPLLCRVIRPDGRKPTNKLPDVPQMYFNCNIQVLCIRECDHSFRTNCFDAYYGNQGPCDNLVSDICPDCSTENKYKCRQYRSRRLKGLPLICNNIVQKLCATCNINVVVSKCHSDVLIQCRSKVTGRHPCGHDVSWICGEVENPIRTQKLCHGCVLPLWESSALFEMDGEIKAALMATLQNQWYQYIETKVLNSCEIRQNMTFLLQEQAYDNFVRARRTMMDIWIHLLRNESKTILLPPPVWGDPADLSNYSIVCQQVKMDARDIHQHVQEDFLKRIDTKYGTGIKLRKLSRYADLEFFTPLDDGSLHLILGVAYNYNALTGVKEFVPTGSNADKQKAKSTQKQYVEFGHDCVEINDADTLYWTPGTVIPLMYVTISAHKDCIVCCDQIIQSKGYMCSNKHFYCWDCFGSSIKNALGPDNIGQPYDDEGNLKCAVCKDICQIHELARAAPKEVFDDLMKLKVQVKERKARDETEKDVTKRMQEEFARIQALNAEEREVELMRLSIVNDILTLKCPRCKSAFTDFDGCFALTCVYPDCHAGFCAWCLLDCGGDAHQHVQACPENRGRDYHGTKVQFEAHHRRRRHRAALQRINTLPPSSQRMIKDKMRRDFRDLGINIDNPPE